MLGRVIRVRSRAYKTRGQGPQKAVLGQYLLHFSGNVRDVRHSRDVDPRQRGIGSRTSGKEEGALSPLPPPHLPQRRLRPLGDLGVFMLGKLLQGGDGVLGCRADHAEGSDGFGHDAHVRVTESLF